MALVASTIRPSTIRPGLLVGLKTSITGNVSYAKTALEEGIVDSGAVLAKWETERRIADPVEHEEAVKVRGKARAMISAICARSDFGLLCPEAKKDDLEQAVREAQALIDVFNINAKCSKIGLYVISGQIAQDDVQAVQAISSDVRDLLSAMEKGIAKFDVKAVREAAMRAKSMAQMLTPSSQERVQNAIKVARDAARKIVKAGEEAAQEIDREAIAAIGRARTAFLDLDGAHADVTTPIEQGRAVDFEPEMAPVVMATVSATQIEVA